MAKATSEIRSIVARYVENLKAQGVPIEKVYIFGSKARRNVCFVPLFRSDTINHVNPVNPVR